MKSEARGMVRKLETAEAPRDQISFFEQAKTTQEDEIRSLQAELVEVEDKYDQLMMDSNLEMATLRMQVLDLEVRPKCICSRIERISNVDWMDRRNEVT